MGVIAWLAIAVGILAVIVGVIAIWMLKRNKNKTRGETNYRVFFITGAVMIAVGLISTIFAYVRDYSFFTMMPIITIGVVYLAIGLGNRSKWRKTS